MDVSPRERERLRVLGHAESFRKGADWAATTLGCFALDALCGGQSKGVCGVCKAEPLCVSITGRLILPQDAREQGQRERVDDLKTFVL